MGLSQIIRDRLLRGTFAALAAVLIVPAAWADAPSRGTWHARGHGVSVQLTQILPDQLRGFYLARGFDAASVEHLVAGACVFQTVMRNESAGGGIRLALADWRAVTPGARRPPRLASDWMLEWERRGVSESARTAFRWALFPAEQSFEPGDWNMGMTTWVRSPGAKAFERFDVLAVWWEGPSRRSMQIAGVLCAGEGRAPSQTKSAPLAATPITGTKTMESLTPVPNRPPAPDFGLRDLDGRMHHLSDYRGRVVLLNFWATWCPPCRKELPSMQRGWEKLKGERFAMLALDVGEDEETVLPYLSATGATLTFPVLLDPAGGVIHQWPVKGLPTTFIIDRDGRIAYRAVGGREWDDPAILGAIRGLGTQYPGGLR